MVDELLKWDIYEVKSNVTPIVGAMFRGRVRKFCLEKNINVLVENTQDIERCVRFGVFSGFDVSIIVDYLEKILDGVSIELVLRKVSNPVLSKLKINIEDRYTLF
jgi:hypothetical protein